MRKIVALLFSLAMLASACSTSSDVGGVGQPEATPTSGDPNVDLDGDDIRLASRLTPFDTCDDLLRHLQSEARDRVGPYGLDYYGYGFWRGEGDVVMMDDAAAEDTADAAEAAPAATGGDGGTALNATDGDEGGGADFTGTNVQELGVDEPDIIKTDGDRILVLNESTLTYIDVADGEAIKTDSLAIPEGWGAELFFQGDRALLFTNNGGWGYPVPFEVTDGATEEVREVQPLEDDVDVGSGDAEAEFAEDSAPPAETDLIAEPYPGEYYGPAATIYEIDLSDPSDLRIEATLRIEGQYLSARSVGATVRLALTSGPNQLPWVFPSNPNGEDRAEEFNRQLIDETVIEDWIPEYELTVDGATTTGPLLDCTRLHRPAEFAGFDVVSVLSFDLDGGLDPGEGVGVLASGQTVYASTDRFYVATTQWVGPEIWDDADAINEWSEDYTTDIHAFSISTEEPAAYVGSGTVGGSLLNQFSMDEHDGYLRIITTEGSPWDERNRSETQLVVLQEDDDVLVQVGQVGGLGKGESLYSARLLDDIGFAVTFRQIDPFYVLDLSDPTDPKVSGELKIPGFSTYLHPVDDSHVLGIGQDATEEGRTTGLKLSLFDVSDVSDPREVATWTMAEANSPAEWDHRAFQIFDGTAIVPVQTWNGEFNGAVLFDLSDGTIVEVGRVSHIDDADAPSSDCEPVTTEDLSEDSELYWIALEGHVQVCGPGDDGGYGTYYCERIPAEELQYWFADVGAAEAQLERLGIDDDDRIEFCWPDGGWNQQIQRTLVIGDTLWSMSRERLQANDLDSLEVIDRIGIL